MANKLNEEIADEQAGFRPGKGTRDQIMNNNNNNNNNKRLFWI